MHKAKTIRGGGNRTARLLLPLCTLLIGILLCSCIQEQGVLGVRANLSEAEIRPLIEQGAYEEALLAIRDSAELTDAARVSLERSCRYGQGVDAEEAGDDRTAYAYYEQAAGYADAAERMTHCRARLALPKARALFDAYDFAGAFAALDALGGVSEAEEARQAWLAEKPDKLMQLYGRAKGKLAAGAWYTAALTENGALFAGDGRYDQAALPQDADAVYAGVVGLLYQKDGTLTAYGDGFGKRAEIAGLTGVVDAAAGINHIVAALSDGTAKVLGSLSNGRGLTEEWADIAAVTAGAFHSVGLRTNGAVVATGDNAYGQCEVSGWTDVTQVRAGLYHTVGLRADGTVVAAGDNTYGQCEVSAWTDVLAVYCGATHTVALKKDFTVVAAGNNAAGQCEVSGWQLFSDLGGDLAPVRITAEGQPDELVFWGEEVYGPWLYLYRTGAVQIAFDEATEDKILRADLYAAQDSGWVSAICGGENRKQPVAAAELARENRLVFGITGDYLNVTVNPQGIKIRQGKVYNDNEPITSFCFDEAGRMIFVDTTALDAQDLLDQGVTDYWTFGPALLMDGEKLDISNNHFSKYPALRCVIATVEPYHNLSLASGYGRDDGLFLSEIQDLLLGYGATDAYNMDGGNSNVFVFMGELLNRSSKCVRFTRRGIRPLADLLGFLQSDAVPAVDEPYMRGNQPVERRK